MASITRQSVVLSAWLAALTGCATPAASPTPPQPQLTLEITGREDVPGQWGTVGQYERLTGVVRGEVDPNDPRNALIQDLALADTNARGMVAYASEFAMLKPKDMRRANGTLRVDAPNRGNILTTIDTRYAPGDALYLERGWVMLYPAWQGDVPKSAPQRLTLQVPLAHNRDGSSITGPYRAELVPQRATPAMTLPGGTFNNTMLPYAPVSLDTTQPGNTLTRAGAMKAMRANRSPRVTGPSPTVPGRSPFRARRTRPASACAAASTRPTCMKWSIRPRTRR